LARGLTPSRGSLSKSWRTCSGRALNRVFSGGRGWTFQPAPPSTTPPLPFCWMATARLSQPLRLSRPKLTDREEGIGAGGVLGLIAALGEPGTLRLQLLNPKRPGAAAAEQNDVEGFVHDHVGIAALGGRQFSFYGLVGFGFDCISPISNRRHSSFSSSERASHASRGAKRG